MGIAQFQRIVFIVFCCNFLQHIIAHQIQRRDIFQCYRMPAYGKTIYVCIAFYLIALHCIALYCIVHCTVYTYSSQGTGGEWDMAVTVRNPLYGEPPSEKQIFTKPIRCHWHIFNSLCALGGTI